MTSHGSLPSLVHPIIGVVRGVRASTQVVQYLGVPYATLQDAFARAQPITYMKSEFVLNATQHGPTVINPPGVCDREQELIQARIPYTPRGQSATQGLTLNISVPASTKASDGLPVLVFVHGGGFANGSANHPHYDLERLVELSVKIRNPIIAVGVKPNNGLDDQRVALRWIKRHIGGFGGDGERITFLGQSAGGVAGNIHLESAEPLFEQYISMAGTAFSRPRRVEAIQKAYDGLIRDLGVADALPEEQVKRLLQEVEQDNFAAQALMDPCCLKGFPWKGTPKGQNGKLAGRDCYVTGTNSDVAILVLHDMYGWTFTNTRLLAYQYAEEVGATASLPDLFGGEVLPVDIINDQSRWAELDLPGFLARNTKQIRMPEIIECAQALRQTHKRTGAIGFCFGGWGVFRLGARGQGLVDCISTAHPSHLEEDEIRSAGVPTQILAPEIDPMFTEELKAYSNRVIPTLGIAYDYQFFPGVAHAFATRGDPANLKEQKALERAKNAAVAWFAQWLSAEQPGK